MTHDSALCRPGYASLAQTYGLLCSAFRHRHLLPRTLRKGTKSQRAVIRQAIEQSGAALDLNIEAIESTGGLDDTARLAQDGADQALESPKALPDTPCKRRLAALVPLAVGHTT